MGDLVQSSDTSWRDNLVASGEGRGVDGCLLQGPVLGGVFGRRSLGGQWQKNTGFDEVDVLLDLLGDAVPDQLLSF